MTGRLQIPPDRYAFTIGGNPCVERVALWSVFEIFTEDCFSGMLTSSDGKPREVAPFPYVNPLSGPLYVDGIEAGDVLAVHLASVSPARDWGVSTVSPDFGTLSGTHASPNLQPPLDEQVWIWHSDPTGTMLRTDGGGRALSVPLRPFHGTIGVAPAHGEVRLGVVPGAYGGNLDLPVLGTGATLYLRCHTAGAELYVGDGHYAQGDGEFAGTAVEGAMITELMLGRLAAGDPTVAGMEWPRIETDDDIVAVGCGRPLEEAFRVAVNSMVRWIAAHCDLSLSDAYQLASQSCQARVGNIVNPTYTATVSVRKDVLPGAAAVMDGTHDRLRTAVR